VDLKFAGLAQNLQLVKRPSGFMAVEILRLWKAYVISWLKVWANPVNTTCRPDERFAKLPGFAFEPHYAQIGETTPGAVRSLKSPQLGYIYLFRDSHCYIENIQGRATTLTLTPRARRDARALRRRGPRGRQGGRALLSGPTQGG
jgi:hypothetical protein